MKDKKLLFLGIFAVIFVGFVTTVNATSNSITVDKEYEAYLERNWAQVELSTKVQNRITDYYGIKEVFKDKYPSYFGGMYISDDASHLVIQIAKNNIPKEDSKEYSIYNEIINMDSSIQIEYVENSFNDLNIVNNNVSDYLTSGKATYRNIKSTYISVMDNTVVVELADNSEVKQERFKTLILDSNTTIDSNTVLDSKLIKFNQGDEYHTMANINAGGKYLRVANDPNNYCSMGFRTRYNGKNGYVTAGHCAVGYSSFPSGTIRLKQFATNKYYDYAFVETNSSYIPTNTLDSSGVSGMTKLAVITYSPYITVNMAIGKVGATTGYSAGNVTGLNITADYTNPDGSHTYIKGMVQSAVYAAGGDSGAIVFIPRTDANGGAVPLGILSGGNGSIMFFTEIRTLPAALQTGTY